jgi:hypothetical protein
MVPRRFALLTPLAVTIALALLGWLRWQNPALDRPFIIDEVITVRYYTWTGVAPSGEERPLKHIDEFYALERPTALQLATGLYFSLGRWPEPNNQVVNSFLVNIALAIGGVSERTARLPALLGGLVFVAALYYLCAGVLRWRTAAPVVAAWAWFLPYVEAYSLTARGYSWMLALQVLLLIWAYQLPRTRRPVLLGSLVVAVAVLSVMNVVSLAVDLILPYFLVLFWRQPHIGEADEPAQPAGDLRRWRQYVAAMALATAGMTAVFFVSHLPILYSSARQYGLPFASVGELAAGGAEIAADLFPDCWSGILAGIGIAGLIALGRDRRYRWLALFIAVLLVVNLVHFLATRRLPHGRVMGYLLPLVLLGAAYLIEWAAQVYNSAFGRLGVLAVFGAAVIPVVVFSPGAFAEEDRHLGHLLALANEVRPTPGHDVFVPVITSGMDYLISLYAPRHWRQIDTVTPGQKLDVMVFTQSSAGLPTREGREQRRVYRLSRLAGQTQPLPDQGSVPAGAWIFWYPEFTRLGLSGAEQTAFMQSGGYPIRVAFARRQVKYYLASLPEFYLIQTPATADSEAVTQFVRRALRQLGGRAVVFIPSETSTRERLG